METQPLFDVYISYMKHLVRAPAIATATFFILHPFYNRLYSKLSNEISDAVFLSFGLWIIHVACYWIINTFFFICDTYGYLSKYKLPRKQHQIPTKKQIIKTIRGAIIGQIFIEFVGAYYIIYPSLNYFGSQMTYNENEISQYKLYYISLIYLKYVFCTIVNSWLFYFAHRLLHLSIFYGRIHKQHHEYTGTISFAAEYAHPIEGLFANNIPTLLGPILTGSHPLQFFIWLFWRLQETYESHSGFSFYNTWLHKIGLTNADSALFHDFHHSNNIGNYSGIHCDALFGTANGWNDWFQKWKKNTKIKNEIIRIYVYMIYKICFVQLSSESHL